MLTFAQSKRYFFYVLIATLIASALVAVVSVLVGEFNDLMGKVLMTFFTVIVHSLISLLFIYHNEHNSENKFDFFTNVIFLIIILSFLTSIFGVWDIFSNGLIRDFYYAYFLTAFVALHGEVLAKALKIKSYIDKVIFTNFFFMIIVYIMLLIIIFVDNSLQTLGEFYFRALAAAGIIDGTLTILTIIFYRMYMIRHPNEKTKIVKNKGLNPWVWILLLFLFFQILIPLFIFIISFF